MGGQTTPTLEANLRVLDRTAPELATRLRWPVDSSHLQRTDKGALYRYHARELSLVAGELALPPADEGPIFVFGVGLGETVQALLDRQPKREVVAWERDPAVLRLALSERSFAEELAQGSLRLLLGVDLLGALPLAPGTELVIHPVLGRVYQEELQLLRHGIGSKRAIVCEGGLFVEDLTQALRAHDYGVVPLHLTRLSRDEIVRALWRAKPALVAAINYTEGLVEVCAAAGVPLLVWEIDPNIRTLAPPKMPTDGAHIFSYRRASVEEFRGAGFTHVAHLPLATNPARRVPVALTEEIRSRFGAPLSFVGSSMVREAPVYETRFLESYVARFGAEARNAGAALLQQLLAAQRREPARECITALLVARHPDWPEARQVARFASEIASAERRIMIASRLGRFGLQVWGDEGWRVTGGTGVTYRGPAAHGDQLTQIYCASKINLDVGRLYQLDIVTMRIFDIMAAGGFVLAERSEDLASLFDLDREIACYATPAELEEKVVYYLAHDDERQALAAAGRAAVLARHTIARRLETMLERVG